MLIPAFKQNSLEPKPHQHKKWWEESGYMHGSYSLSINNNNTDLHLSYSNKEHRSELNCIGSDELGLRRMWLYGYVECEKRRDEDEPPPLKSIDNDMWVKHVEKV